MPSGIDLLGKSNTKSGLNLLGPDPSYSFEPSEASDPYLSMISESEVKHGLPKNLLSNIIHTESRFKSDAKSKVGAVGIAQIMPKYHPDVDPTDPAASIDYAGNYLKNLYNQFGSWDKAIAAYNTGPGNLKKLGMGNLPKETKDYLERVNAARVSEEAKPMSGLDLLKPEVESTVGQPPAPVILTPRDAETFYGIHAVSPPFQGLAPMIWSPEIASYMGKQGFGPKPEGGWDELGVPLDKDGKPYYEPEKATGVIAETLQGISSLATHPMEVVRGGLDFFLSVPGFLTGILSASSAMTKRTLDIVIMGTDTTLEDLYNIASEEMMKSMEFFDPGKRLITGEPTPESELATQVVMAPLTGLSMVGHKVADYEGFKNYPNVRGAARFAGDIAGLATMGFLLHRGSKVEFTRDVEKVVKEADKIIVEEQAVQGIPNEIIKQAGQKSIEARKVQLDLEAKKVAEKVAEETLVKGEAAKQAEGIIKAKSEVKPVEVKPPSEMTEAEYIGHFKTVWDEYSIEIESVKSGVKPAHYGVWADKAAIKKAKDSGLQVIENVTDIGDYIAVPKTAAGNKTAKRLIELSKEREKVFKTKDEDLIFKWNEEFSELLGYTKEEAQGLIGITGYADRATEAKRIHKLYTKEAELKKPVVELPKVEEIPKLPEGRVLTDDFITELKGKDVESKAVIEVDRQTGVDLPELKGEVSPFFQGKEKTESLRKIYDERAKSVESDPELLTQKLINDANRWYHGDESIPIGKVRETLSTVALRADELRMDFITGQDHLLWKETIIEAADWARNLDRLDVGEVTLYRATSPTVKFEDVFKTEELTKFKPPKGVEGEFYTSDYAYADYFRETFGKDAVIEEIKIPVEEAKLYEQRPGEYFVPKDRSIIKPTVEPTKLYAGISPKEIIKSARKVADYTRKARGMKVFKPAKAVKALREEFTRTFIDRSGNIRRKLLDDLGADGYEVVQAMYLARGSSSIAAKSLMQMRKEIYRGLSKVEKKILDDLILADRMIDIGKYKTEKEFKHPEGMTVEDFVRYRQAYKYKAVNSFENLTAAKAESINQKAKGYFEWMRKALKDMLDAELISEKEFNDLASHNYRRIKLVDVYDQRYKTKVGKKVRTVYDSGVEALSKGRETDIYESSSEIMALEVFNRTYGRILNNEANKTLLNLARRDSTNPFVRVREKKGDMIPTGWNRIFVYEKGERKSIYISPEMSKEWITTNPDMSYRQSQLIRYVSGSPVLRTFATGINWGFALANLPRDVMHTWFAARVFEDGKWKPIYSSTLPIFNLQIGRDLVTTFSDAALRKGRYERYIKEGGGMEFLVHQGRLFQRGKHIEGPLDAIYNFMGYFGETSEIMSRLAIRERVLRRRAKEGKTTVKELDKGTKESKEATFAARDYMDFGQGGWATKTADNAIPYLNASIVGTRGLWRAFKDNSVSSTYKLAQFATVVSGLYIAAIKLTPLTMEALKGNVAMQNNLCIPLGDDFGFDDGRGQMRYPFFKIPLDPGQKFFKTFFEASTDKWLGNPVDVNRVVDSLKEQSPVGVTELPPSVSGVLGYTTNKDFWMNEDIWRKTDKPFGWPESKEEYIPGVTPEAYVDIGKLTGLSPERLRYTVEELTTSGTMWSWLLGKGYDATFGDLPKPQKEQHLAEVLSKTPIIKRFFGITNPYSQFAGSIEEAEEESSLKRFTQNRGLDMRAEGYLFKDNMSKKEVFDYIKNYKDIDIADRLTDRFEFQVKTKDLPNRTFWLRLKGLSTEARAKVFVDRMDQLTSERQEQLRKEMGKVVEIGGVITDSFLDEVGKIRLEK